MSHFAKVNVGTVIDVIVAEQDFVDTLSGAWVQTSYNTHGGVHYGQDGQPDGGVALRYNYARLGGVYDSIKDAFYVQQPYPSWTLDGSTCYWVPPTVIPEDEGEYPYHWDEDTLSWVRDE